jgi:hypothetical protein
MNLRVTRGEGFFLTSWATISFSRRTKLHGVQFVRLRDCGLDSSGSGLGPVAGSCEHGNEGGEFLD